MTKIIFITKRVYVISFTILLSALNVFAYQSPPRETVWDEIMFEQSLLNMRKGVSLMNREKYIDAANEFIKAISKNPRDANARIFYGSSLYWLGDIDKALDEYAIALEIDPKNALALQLTGIAHAWRGAMGKALKYFLNAEKHAPHRSDIKMNLGSVYHSFGRFDKALFYFRQALKIDSKNPLYNYQLGALYKRLGRYYDAINCLNAAVRADRNYEDAVFELAVLYEKIGNVDKALGLYKRALSLKPFDGAARFRLSLALLKKGKFKQIEDNLAKAFSLTPQNKKGGISLNLMYSGMSSGKPTKTSEDESSEKRNDSVLNSIENALRKIKQDEDIRLNIELISLPKTEIVSFSGEKNGSLKGRLNRAFNRPKASYGKREYFVGEVEVSKRDRRISDIINEIDKMLKESDENNDARISVNIETLKRESGALSSAEGEVNNKVVYNPRMVGNDMGLWVIGRNWLESVDEGLIEIEDFLFSASKKPPIAYAVMGLGNLILGRVSAAEDNFDKISSSLPLFYNLGMSVMWVEKGDEKKALHYSNKALEADSENKVAFRNKKWLSLPIRGKREK